MEILGEPNLPGGERWGGFWEKSWKTSFRKSRGERVPRGGGAKTRITKKNKKP